MFKSLDHIKARKASAPFLLDRASTGGALVELTGA